MTIDYLDPTTVINARASEPPRPPRADGYGNKIPSALELQLQDKRWRRVYVVCWGNSSTAYVIVCGKARYITSNQLQTWTIDVAQRVLETAEIIENTKTETP